MQSELFEAVPDALIMVDRSGVITHANRNAEQLLGYERGALIGQSVELLMPSGMRGRHRQHRGEYVEQPRVRAMGSSGQALVGLTRDGRELPVEIALSPIETDQGQRYLASIRDISESLRARQILARARYDAIIASIGQLALEARDENMIDGLPALLAESLGVDCVAILLQRTHSSQFYARAALGLRAEWPDPSTWPELPDLRWQDAMRARVAVQIGNDALSGFADVASAALVPMQDREQIMGAVVALSSRAQRFDHDAMHLLQSAALLLTAFLQRRHTEEQLAHVQRLDAIGQLTGGIAHDFNNLLTVISGSLQLLEMECGEHREASSLIASASRSVARGAELTGKLLAFARRQRLLPKALALSEMLSDLAVMLRRTLGESIQVDIHCSADLPPVFADAAQLDTALINLALNARDAMPRGGIIAISAEPHMVAREDLLARELAPGSYVEISVVDTGHGMTSEVLARALDPFFTTKESGRGSGLGLSMVYGFVKQSGGHMSIDSQLGYGTRAMLYLPVARTSVVETAAPRPREVQSGSETILIVEDQVDVAQVAAAFLRSLGYGVITAHTADEAMQRLIEQPQIALLFTDVLLGDGMNGIELAQAVRQRRPNLPVLLTSGYTHSESPETPDQAHAFELLHKPYRREQLAAAVRRSLDAS